MAIYRYHVRDASGSMSFDQTEAQKDAMVAAGGSIVNRWKVSGEEPTPVVEEAPSSITAAPPPVEYVDDVPELSQVPKYDDLDVVAASPPAESIDDVPELVQVPKYDDQPKAVDINVMLEQVAPVEDEYVPIFHSEDVDAAPPPAESIDEIPELIQIPKEDGVELFDKPKPVVLLDTSAPVSEPSPLLISAETRIKADPDSTTTEAYVSPVDIEPVEPELFTITQFEPDMVTHLGIEMTRAQFEADFPGIPDSEAPTYSPAPLVTDLPAPADFVGIPGPASARKPGSISETIQDIIDTKIQEFEEGVIGFQMGARQAGREMGAEAQVALEEGDVGEALMLGTAAFTARASVGVIDALTFPIRPLAWQKTAGALYEGAKGALEAPEDIPGGITKWAGQVARDPGAIVEFAGDIAVGFAIAEVISTIRGPTHKVSRVDVLDVDVKAKALGMVDEVDPFTGKSVKVPQFPEAEFIPTVSKKRIPKAVSELMGAELDEVFSGKAAKIMGVTDEAGRTRIVKIDVSTETLQDVARGKPVTVMDSVSIETIQEGFGRWGDDLAIKAKELSDELPIKTDKQVHLIDELAILDRAEDASFDLPTLGEDGIIVPRRSLYEGIVLDEVDGVLTETLVKDFGGESTTFLEIPEGKVKFGGPWFEEGVEGVLEKGKHRYDVKGVLLEDTPSIIDDIPEFKPIEPGTGSKTPLNETFGFGQDVIQESIVKEITEGVLPIASVLTEPAAVSAGVAVGLGVGAALENIPHILEDTGKPLSEITEGMLKEAPVSSIIDEVLGETGDEPTPAPIIDIIQEPIQDTTPFVTPIQDIIQDPIQEPVIVPPKVDIFQDIIQDPIIVPPKVDIFQDIIQDPIQDTTPIIDVIEDPIQDTIPVVTPIIDVIEEQKLVRPPPFFTLLGPRRVPLPIRRRKPPLRKRQKRPYDPLGWEERKYPMTSIEDLMGVGRRRAPRRTPRAPKQPPLGGISNIFLGTPPKSRKSRKKKKKTKPKKRRKKR